jgi:hypothetical protein
LSETDATAIHDYLIGQTHVLLEYEASSDWWQSTQTWFYELLAGTLGLFL